MLNPICIESNIRRHEIAYAKIRVDKLRAWLKPIRRDPIDPRRSGASIQSSILLRIEPPGKSTEGTAVRSTRETATTEPIAAASAASSDSRLSRWDLAAEQRAHITRESISSTPSLTALVPQAALLEIHVPTPKGWNAYNPSIANTSRGLLMTVRSSNWEYKRHHYYRVNDAEGIARSRSYLLHLDADLTPISSMLLRDGTDRTGEVAARYRGYDDLRLFEVDGQLGAVATTLDFSRPAVSQMALLGISGDRLIDRRLISDGRSRGEKNWSPAIWNGELFLVYSYAPMTLLRWDGRRLQPAGLEAYLGPPIAIDFRGGSQLIPTPAGYLAVVHASADYPDESRVYVHRFVLLDEEFRITGVSPQFTFRQRGIEFAAGIARQRDDVIVSFGVADAECWLVRLPLASVLALLNTPVAGVPSPDDEAARRVWPSPPDRATSPVLVESTGQHRSSQRVARSSPSPSVNRPAVVTTMLIPQSDGHTTRPVTAYLAHFKHLIATGLPIVAYVAPTLTEQVRAPNVTVVPTTLEDLPLWREIQGMELRLPATRNSVKDTADYLALQNSKTELVRRTIAITEADADSTHAFVDFGIFHFIRDAERAQQRLRALGAVTADLVTLPGCTLDVSDDLDRVNWRFCGSLFFGTATAMQAFAELHQKRARTLLPALSWEVNVWAWMERHGELACRWYQADHNDTIFDFPDSGTE